MKLLREEDVEGCWRALNHSWVQASEDAQTLLDQIHAAEERHRRGEGPAPLATAYTLAHTLQRMARERQQLLVGFEQRYRRWRKAVERFETA